MLNFRLKYVAFGILQTFKQQKKNIKLFRVIKNEKYKVYWYYLDSRGTAWSQTDKNDLKQHWIHCVEGTDAMHQYSKVEG